MMSANKISNPIRTVNVPVFTPVSERYSRSSVSQLLNRLANWLSQLIKEKPVRSRGMDSPPGNVRFTDAGQFHISDEDARREREIDVLSVNLMFPKR